MRYDFAKFLTENDLPDPWAFKEQSDKQNNTTPKAKANDVFQKFLDMVDLRWGEVEITTMGNGRIRVSARKESVIVSSGEFGLINKTTGRPNEIYCLFVSFAANQRVDKNRKMTVDHRLALQPNHLM